MENLIEITFLIIGIYLFLGVLFTIILMWNGLEKLDPQTKGAGWFFKLLIFPGMTAFWVVFLRKWLKQKP
ncbi:MAG: hypothetical protein R3A50_07520 [Saprospiraceae bacterium]|nr:hypothetical protein [Saprospiraceae bacterium]MCB9345261.1 hypothetical protein [Lewinellaceae bacterium]